MAEDQAAASTGNTGKPTMKQLEFARNIATKLGIRVPDEVLTSFDECSKFINDNKDSAMRPSEKQVKYAESIATNKNLEIPAEALANGKELSAWIDKNK